jgi:hypothetical protein
MEDDTSSDLDDPVKVQKERVVTVLHYVPFPRSC